MNWGYKILIVYVAFVLMISGMVYVSSKQINEMQDENYYVKELQYQDVIDGKNNLLALHENVDVADESGMIRIKLPQIAATNLSNGKIYFLRPSAERNDVRMNLAVNKNGEQFIPKNKFVKGYYTVQVSWKNDTKIYYSEQSLNVKE